MGGVCCCLHVDNFEEYVNPNSSTIRNCIFLNCFMQGFLNAYTTLFQRREVHALPLSAQGATSLTSTASLDNSLAEIYHSPPRPLPYDSNPRCLSLQRDRREKGSSHSHEETEPLRRINADGGLDAEGKYNGSGYGGGSKECHLESSLKHSFAKETNGFEYLYSSSEDEDVCPTCLEEYTPENPKIVTQCCHHFHLGCIYEWMERSETCPVCGKVMVFNET